MADRLRQTFPPVLNYLKIFPVIRGLVDLMEPTFICAPLVPVGLRQDSGI